MQVHTGFGRFVLGLGSSVSASGVEAEPGKDTVGFCAVTLRAHQPVQPEETWAADVLA